MLERCKTLYSARNRQGSFRRNKRSTLVGVLSPVLPLPNRFVIVASGRTGSHLLVDLLDGQPGVRCDGEILGQPIMSPSIAINGRALLAKKSGAHAYGFKLHLNQVTVVQSLDAARWFQLLHESGWTILHLSRANILHQAVSAQRAWQTQFHFKVGQVPAFEPLEIDPVAILATMSFIEDNLRRTREALGSLASLELVYERDLATEADQRRTLERVCGQLGFDPQWSPSRYARVQPASGRDMLANYDEVAKVLEQTRYARYLQDLVPDVQDAEPLRPDFPGQAPHGVVAG